MDDVFQCGNDLRFLEAWLHHHKGDPRFRDIIGDLAAITQNLVQVVVSSQITNAALSREFRAESAKALTAATNRLATAQSVQAAA